MSDEDPDPDALVSVRRYANGDVRIYYPQSMRYVVIAIVTVVVFLCLRSCGL